jgi:hypothetical protein
MGRSTAQHTACARTGWTASVHVCFQQHTLFVCVISHWLQVMKYLFSGQPELRQACEHLLRVQPDKVTPEQLLQDMLEQVRRGWSRLPPHHFFAHVPTPLQGETLSPFAEPPP